MKIINASVFLFTTPKNRFSASSTMSSAAVREDAGPSAVMTTQLPRLSWRVTTDDDLVIFSFDPRILRWNQICAANSYTMNKSIIYAFNITASQLLDI